MRRLLSNKQIAYLTNSDAKDIELLNIQPLVGFFSARAPRFGLGSVWV